MILNHREVPDHPTHERSRLEAGVTDQSEPITATNDSQIGSGTHSVMLVAAVLSG